MALKKIAAVFPVLAGVLAVPALIGVLAVPALIGVFAVPVLIGVFAVPAGAGEADVVDVKVRPGGNGFHFSVSVRHADAGWDHYANRWDVLAPDGTVLGERVLMHPHENEQPFTRGLSGVRIPAGISEVTVRANDLVHGTGGKTMIVKVPGR